jgi:hypothetical protein
LNEEHGREEGDNERRYPLGGLVVAELDTVCPEDEDGGNHARNAKYPSDNGYPPRQDPSPPVPATVKIIIVDKIL